MLYSLSIYLVVKWPFEERVQFCLHEYKEHREMGLVSNTISIDVGSDPHLIPITVWRKYTVVICTYYKCSMYM